MRSDLLRQGAAGAAASVGIALAVGFLPVPLRPVDVTTSAPVRAARVPVPVEQLTFDDAVARAAALPRLRSLLVAVDGRLLVERYFHGVSAARSANIKSASKSVLAMLVGIAIDRGEIGSIADPVGRYLPEYVRGAPEKAAITIEDLLTMRSGLESTSSRNYGRWVQSANWVRFVLERPMIDEPGGRMIYSTGSSHVLSAILTKATRSSTFEFARRTLAGPLGIDLPPWQRDPQGIYLGGNEMAMKPRDMLRIGELVLGRGRYRGRQVVPEAWLETSMVPRTTSAWSGREYGYGWWLRSSAGVPTSFAWGYGGQFIFVLPAIRTVVVATSVTEPGTERHDHLQAIYDMLDTAIVPTVETAFPQT
ncbi:MAG: serine hydrolase [Acidobacteria bacterium]|nr:serine hydrolase [Acidobacteriota bacterium]